jgi:tryptophanyl-tRNA synthetase
MKTVDKAQQKPVLFSGIQPSGALHLGHFTGAIRQWKEMQTSNQCFFAIVDLHSLTVRQPPKVLQNNCYEVLSWYLALGLDHPENVIFCQSHVAEHSELAWILNCYSYMGELSRMTQFKDKSQKQAANINVGLFDYPVLMAADILLYHTNFVPVGKDQKQHVELARDIALRFNNIYGEIFTIPQPFIPARGERIMSLQDPTKKMSKTDPDSNATINLFDSPEIIIQKMKRSVTDSGKEIIARPDKPGITNLLTIYHALTNEEISSIEAKYQNQGYGKFKSDLAEAIISFLIPIQEKFKKLRQDENYLNSLLKKNAEKARQVAYDTLKKVHSALGMI